MKSLGDSAFIFLIAFLVSLTPFAVDTYLVAMPSMAIFFHTSLHNIELTVAIFLLGYALGQLLGGPLSDNFGRKNMALIGLFIFLMSSFLIFMASTITELLIFRFCQAFGGGFALVNGASSIRDRFSGDKAAKVFSNLTLIMSIPPLIAPLVGSFLFTFFGWEYIFLFLGMYACCVFMAVLFYLPNNKSSTNQNFLQIYKEILTHKIAIRYILVMALCFSGLFIFIAKSSFIYVEYFHISPSSFAYFFGANVLAMMFFNRINFILLKKIAAKQLLFIGVILQCLAALGLIITSVLDADVLITLLFLALYIGALGMIFGNSMALTLEFFPHCGGSATAVIGITEFLVSGLIGACIMQIQSNLLTPYFMGMMAVSTASLLILAQHRQLSLRFPIKS